MSGPDAKTISIAQAAGHTLAALKMVHEALGRALSLAEQGKLSLPDLAAIAPGGLQPQAVTAAVAALVARVRTARTEMEGEAAQREAALAILKLIAQVAEMLLPVAAALL